MDIKIETATVTADKDNQLDEKDEQALFNTHDFLDLDREDDE